MGFHIIFLLRARKLALIIPTDIIPWMHSYQNLVQILLNSANVNSGCMGVEVRLTTVLCAGVCLSSNGTTCLISRRRDVQGV